MLRRRDRSALLEPLDGPALRAEIDRLDRARRTPKTDRELIARRHELGVYALDHPVQDPQHPQPAATLPPGDDLPEFAPADLTPEVLRAAILRDGCALVRGLVPKDDALELAAGIDRAFAQRDRGKARAADEFVPADRYGPIDPAIRTWVQAGGGLLAGDAPPLARDFLAMVERTGLARVIEGYLGETPLLTFEKTTLRKADPAVTGAWHQDGKFMGPVRALNLWLSLSRCGDLAPGLDIVPRRLNELVAAGGPDAFLDYQVTDATASAAAEPKQILRPIFEPGDALLFDELFLHQTASETSMPNPRYAVESWFFGASAFPDYAPIAV